MLFDIGWPELMLIGVIALVVIGPKDLPRALKVAGFWVRKARSLSREFQSHVDQMIREAELDDMHEELKKATEIDLDHEFHQTIDPDGSLAESIKPPGLPDYFTEGAGEGAAGEGQRALPPPDAVAPEAPIATDMPEPDFVGFEAEALPKAPAPVGDAVPAPPKP
jgi:sec-independent protein translocase protein TatB